MLLYVKGSVCKMYGDLLAETENDIQKYISMNVQSAENRICIIFPLYVQRVGGSSSSEAMLHHHNRQTRHTDSRCGFCIFVFLFPVNGSPTI